MPIFARNKIREVHGFVLKVVNNNCPEIKAQFEGPRLDYRVNLTVVVVVIPLEGGKPRLGRAFTAVTKEFSAEGVGVVLDEPPHLDHVVLGFRWEGEMVYLRAEAKHVNPLGGGFYQVGLHMTEVLKEGDYPELRGLSF